MQIQINDLKFDVDTAGQPGDDPVLLLHGFPQSAYSWRHQLPVLAANGYFAIAPNQRGYSAGARPPEIEDYATEALLADALAIVEHFDYPEFHLVGHDWGGQLAWLLAAQYPERVKTLTVLSRPHPLAYRQAMKNDPEQAGRSGHHKAFQATDAADLMVADEHKTLRASLRNQGVPAEDVNAYIAQLSSREAMNAAINWYRAAGSLGLKLGKIETPTLYVWGTDDATVGRAAAEATRDYVTGPYTFIELDGVGHFSTDVASDQINQALLDHLGTHG